MERLDKITIQHGGRFYLAKDGRMARDIFQQSEIRAPEFIKFRNSNSSYSGFVSSQSKRLGL